MSHKRFKTEKAKRLIKVLPSEAVKGKKVSWICREAGISEGYYYYLRRNPAFISQIQQECAAIGVQYAPRIMNTFAKKGEAGSFKHGELVLKSVGVITDQPIINQVFATFNKEGMSEEDIDKKLSQYFTNNAVDIKDGVVGQDEGEG